MKSLLSPPVVVNFTALNIVKMERHKTAVSVHAVKLAAIRSIIGLAVVMETFSADENRIF